MKLKREKVLALMHLWMWWSNCIHVNAADDSVKPGDRLNLSETSRLYSENRKYYLTLSDGYLTVNHEYIGQKIVVWIDYTNQPVEGNSAVLSLNHSGVLKIESQLGDSIIICSPRQPINNTVATILDTGNFVLQQLHPNGTNTTLWQSFDYSFRNLLPSMKLGVNHKTGHRWIVVSYFANILAYPGTFSLEWEPMGKELVIRRRGIVCWRSGKLRNNRFENIPEDAQRMLKYTIVSNVDEDSFSFTATNNEDVIWAISNDGELVDYDRTLASADMCYGYNDTNGCQRWQDIPMCRHRGDVFQRITGHFYNGLWSELNDTYDSPGCRDICWSNCICAGYKEYYPDGSGCTFFNSELGGYTLDNGGEKFYMLRNLTHRSGNSTTKSSQTPGIQRWKWISAVIASAVFFVCFTILCLVLKKRNYTLQEKKRKEKAMMMSPSTSRNESSALKDFEDALEKGHLKVFNYASIMIATNGFSAENKIGQGGFGDVYKGILPTGQEIAIKRLSKTSAQGNMEFKNELTLICELQHKNLVQLLGCCIYEEEKILVYEYMSNKSLDFYLFDGTRRKLLDWKMRFNVIEGISQGLLYLHKYSRLKVIHRDLKASNILLDENMNPKILDFGMAIAEESVSNTNRVVGT